MNSQLLLYINVALGILFTLYFLFGRSKPNSPTRLNLKNKDSEPFEATNVDRTQVLLQKKSPNMTILEPEDESVNIKKQPKDLAIFFIYNGHDWEAYTILGVAQGAHMKAVTEAYQKLLKTSDPQSYPFYEAAYKSILSKKRRDVL